MTLRRVRLIALLAVAGMSAGCVEDLPEAWKIEDLRLLGVRVEVEGEPERAWIRPGETARVSLLTAHPELDRSVDGQRMMAVVCTPLDVGIGAPLCREFLTLGSDETVSGAATGAEMTEAIEAVKQLSCEQAAQALAAVFAPEVFPGFQVLCVAGDPQFAVTVPAEVPEQDEERLVRGVLCERGEPFVDPNSQTLFGCRSPQAGEEIAFSFTISIQKGDATNLHPSFDGVVVTLDGTPWGTSAFDDLAPLLVPDTGGRLAFDCSLASDLGLLQVVPGSSHLIRVRAPAEQFEPFDEQGVTRHEELRFGAYVIEGELDRNRSVLQVEDAPLSFDLEWKAPGAIPEKGMLAPFILTVRDQRGGFDSTELVLCVTTAQEP